MYTFNLWKTERGYSIKSPPVLKTTFILLLTLIAEIGLEYADWIPFRGGKNSHNVVGWLGFMAYQPL